MTSKDKPTRGGGKPAGGAKAASFKSGKSAGGGKPAGDRPHARKDGDRPFAKKDGDRPFAKKDGDKPFARKEGDRPFARKDSDRPYAKKDGDKPYARKDGDKPFAKRDGKPAGKSFAKRDDRRDERRDDRPARPVRDERFSGVRNTPSAEAGDGKPERISKLLARAGVASRRDVERMILDGRVRLNGKILDTPVVNATMSDIIEVDGQPIRGIERTRLWLYHKPAGLVTTNADPEGRPTVFDNLPEGLPRVLSIGRLDINTEGLLLLTNDGGLSRVLELPSTGWLRRYRVRAHGEIDQAELDKLKDGIAVEGVLYGAIEATLDRTQGHNVWITMGLREGKNREIKNVLGALGLEVNRLIRISYGPFQLGDLEEGGVVEVRGKTLRDQLGPRLIEESKANFDAPIYEGPAVPLPEEEGVVEKPWTAKPKAERPARTERPGFGDKPRGEKPRGDKPFGKSDKPFAKGDKPFGKGNDRDGDSFEKKPPRVPGKSRTANVWMAPGARPVGEEKLKKQEALRARDKRTGKAAFTAAPVDPRNAPRVVVNRADDDPDWIRAEAPAKDEGKGFGKKGGFGKKDGFSKGPRRSDDSGEKRPFFRERPEGDRRERPAGDRPERSERRERPAPGEGRPFRERSERSERPAGDRPFRERGDRPAGDRPAGKTFGGKPGGGKSCGG